MSRRRGIGAESVQLEQDELISGPGVFVTLYTDLDDQALAFFFSNHVIGEWHASYGANLLSYGMDDALFAAVKAIGVAALSGFARSSDLNIEARKRYLQAIQSVNNAIVSPESAKRDSTLMSIMLLSQIEAIECFVPERSLTAYENHVKGAAAILKLRGAEKLKTPLEIRLFVQAVSSLMICCAKKRIHLPDHLFELTDLAGQYMKTDAPGWRFFHIQMLATQFAADVNSNIRTDLDAIIEQALELDAMASLIFLDAGPEWSYDTIFDESQPELILLEYYFVDKTFISAQVWNGMRSLRLLLHDIIRKTLLRGFATEPPIFSALEHTAQFQASTDLLFELQNELLASIPQYFLYKSTTNSSPFKFPWSKFNRDIYDPSLTHSPVSENIPLIRSVGGYLLPWLLYRIGHISITKRETVDAILRLLKLTGSEMGIQMAFVLAEDLEKKYAAKSGG